jgi:hypothetical protein
MPIFGPGNANASNISATAIAVATELRAAAVRAVQVHQWMAAISDTELLNAGFTQSDLDMCRSAVADMSAVADILDTGLPPSTYPQPSSAYVYANSMRLIIGPG